MHRQIYDVEEEFEPRITPKPITKLDHFAVPSVPEVSLIFEKSTQARNLIDGDVSSSSARITRSVQHSNKPIEHINVTSPNSGNQNLYTVNSTSSSSDKHSTSPSSYTAWKEQIYSRENNYVNTKLVSPSCKNIYSYNQASQFNIQDATVQKQQEQSKICDTQNRLTNTRLNDGTHEKSVKFRCSDMENSHDHEHETQLQSSDRQLFSCNPVQRATCVTDSAIRMPSNAFVDALKQNEHLQIPYTSCPYPFQQFYTPSYSSRDMDNNETVKTLLQLVNSQSEQIKTLQLQVDRLVRLQEESFRNKSTCACSSSHANQVFGYSAINCYDAANSRAQSQNQGVKQNAGQASSVAENKKPGNTGEDKDSGKLEVALLEQQSKKTFVEQKVSIGVMTSFEFTMQNSPFLVDSEMYKEKETSAGESNGINRRNNPVNMHDTSEPVKRYKNAFTRKPGTAQLENIVEDTESYLSSSHQQSSNFNASSSVRDSEMHLPKQPDLYNTTNTPESPKMYRRLATDLNRDLNREKTREREMRMREGSNTDEQAQSTRIISSRNAGSPMDANCNKAFAVNDYIATDGEKNDDERTHANRHNSPNVHLPATNYYQSHRNKEPMANVREAKNVGDSIVLSGGDFRVFERPPTPEPSIHVEMQEYPSDDESDKLKRTSKIGWTFYNNVLGQVNEILQNSAVIEDKEHHEATAARRVEQEDDTALNTVKATTLEQLRKLGISITDNENRELPNGNNKTLDFDSSYYPRLDRQANMTHATSVVNETNTSMHMKALALKYLGDEELTDIALHKQGSSSLKHLMLSNMQGTNMSFATMRYLERYQLLPGRNQDVQTEDTGQVYNEVAPKRDFKATTGKNNPALRQFPFVQTPGTTCPSRILDISTLKRQPKLL
ncbi:PREDICTED: uncharacterized protein LOC106752166 [Dinoponera quadriceps]|uniref:Uncharacterized protein LOC106752166 n=1 Tax=Dinoponera quadriceps TaxID=609295 RepID=A0A6P3YFD7_DINQU|nr:PREDICTED: uncharacterized protein LOC106752166 [Dinoponera quadriceps]